ncbi:hypothetical protein ACFRU3_10145 [Streptomyces sp. NPDC056910]|uniref:hypothetical protein n=1 Tax=Streptomyces sp. NPDC056910 TaxID=3345964 RepID=UPI003673875C
MSASHTLSRTVSWPRRADSYTDLWRGLFASRGKFPVPDRERAAPGSERPSD